MRFRSQFTRGTVACAVAMGLGGSGLVYGEESPSPVAASSAPADNSTGALEEITVTARRREESAQTTPVSVSVMTSDALRNAGVQNLQDLTAQIPGVNMSESGDASNTVFSIRGMSRGVAGNTQPSVLAYVDEVPLSTWGAAVPTYDIANIQVLKGPQGTLFGRNSSTGAVLVTTAQPEKELGGYVTTTFGQYHWQQGEGALNIPIVQDKVVLRVAGEVARRDGYERNLSSPGDDGMGVHRNSYRASLLVTPIEGLKNTTIYEHTDSYTHGSGDAFYQYTPGETTDTIPYLNGQYRTFNPLPVPCNGSPLCDVAVLAAQQAANGPRTFTTDVNPSSQVDINTWNNTTTYALGPVTFKNIFGLREVGVHDVVDVDGSELAMINSDLLIHTKQLTDEFQFSGAALNDTLSYIVGFFYLDSKPNGSNWQLNQLFAVSGTPFDSTLPAPFNGANGNGDYNHDLSRAVFAQISYKLGTLSHVLDGLSVDAGVRRTKDSESVCDAAFQSIANPPVSEDTCKSTTAGTTSSVDFTKYTYTAGLNYAVTPDIFTYVVTRTGYRAGGINTPVLGGTLKPFQDFRPETTQDVELGAKTNWQIADVRGRFNADVFQSKFKDLEAIIPTAVPNPDGDNNPADDPSSTLFTTNVGKATIRGVEAELTVSPLRGLQLSAAGTYLDKKINSLDVKLPATLPPGLLNPAGISTFVFYGAPDWSYNLGADYTWPLADLGDLRLSAKYFQVSKIAYGSVNAPGYERTDFRATWANILKSRLDVSAFVTNAFDKVGVVAAASSTVGLGANSVIYNEPRIWGMQLHYSFGGGQ